MTRLFVLLQLFLCSIAFGQGPLVYEGFKNIEDSQAYTLQPRFGYKQEGQLWYASGTGATSMQLGVIRRDAETWKWEATPTAFGDDWKTYLDEQGGNSNKARFGGLVTHNGKLLVNFSRYYHIHPTKWTHLRAYQADRTPFGAFFGPMEYEEKGSGVVMGWVGSIKGRLLVGAGWLDKGPDAKLIATFVDDSSRLEIPAPFPSGKKTLMRPVELNGLVYIPLRNGGGNHWYGKPDGTEAAENHPPGENSVLPDLWDSSKGWHDPPYSFFVGVVPVDEFVANKWDNLTWHNYTFALNAKRIDEQGRTQHGSLIGGFVVDGDRLYLPEEKANNETLTLQPVIHEFSVFGAMPKRELVIRVDLDTGEVTVEKCGAPK